MSGFTLEDGGVIAGRVTVQAMNPSRPSRATPPTIHAQVGMVGEAAGAGATGTGAVGQFGDATDDGVVVSTTIADGLGESPSVDATAGSAPGGAGISIPVTIGVVSATTAGAGGASGGGVRGGSVAGAK